MEQIFFITFGLATLILLLISFWFKKPIVGIFAGIFILLFGVLSLQGVTYSNGFNTTLTSNVSGNLTTSLSVNVPNSITVRDTTSFVVYSLFGLLVLFSSMFEIFSSKKAKNVPDVESDNGED